MEQKRAWIYCRVDGPDDLALKTQQTFLEEYVERQGFQIVGITTEQDDGRRLARKGLAEVSGAIANHKVDLLLVTNLSRLGREFVSVDAFLRWLEDQSVKVICAASYHLKISSEVQELLRSMMKESGVSLDSESWFDSAVAQRLSEQEFNMP